MGQILPIQTFTLSLHQMTRTLLYNITNVKELLIHNGRDPRSKVWRGPNNMDLRNEEWEENFKVPTK